MDDITEIENSGTEKPKHERAAARIDPLVWTYAAQVGNASESSATVAADFLADFLHWVAEQGLDPEEVTDEAHRNFDAETPDPGDEFSSHWEYRESLLDGDA